MVQVGPSREKIQLTSFICALLHSRLNSAKLVKKSIFFNVYFYKHYFYEFDVFEMVQVGHSLNKSQSSLLSFVHFCTSV